MRGKSKKDRKRSAQTPNATVINGFAPRPRQSMCTPELTREICSKIAGGDSKTDAALTSGVGLSTFYEWHKRPEFLEAIRQAESTRRRVYRALIRKAGIGDGKKPGDWRATAHLGACTDPAAFVPQVRIHITGQLDDALDKLKTALEPEAYARALHALAGGEGEDSPGSDSDGPGGGGDPPKGS